MKLAWEPPDYEVHEFEPKRTRYCFIPIVWKEGDRFVKQLKQMGTFADEADIIIADRRSTDGSMDESQLKASHVRTLLITDEPGRCTSIRMALAYAIEQKYEGVIMVDGNGKDGIEAVTDFIAGLDEGYDLVQGSRYAPGGHHENTPFERYVAVRFIMSPILHLFSGFRFTDPANGFRGCSFRYLTDSRVQPIRNVFVWDNLQIYLCYRAAKLKMRIKEIPVSRIYPDDGSVPSKLGTFKTKWRNFKELWLTALGVYNP